MVRHVINIDKEKCIGCGMCEKDCIAHNIVVENHKAGVLSNDCIMCGHCAAVCPKEAVAISGYDTQPIPVKGKVRRRCWMSSGSAGQSGSFRIRRFRRRSWSRFWKRED